MFGTFFLLNITVRFVFCWRSLYLLLVATASLISMVTVCFFFCFSFSSVLEGIAYARYSSPQCAAYAREKLNGFEYPLGSALHVQLADDTMRQEYPMNVDNNGFGQYNK